MDSPCQGPGSGGQEVPGVVVRGEGEEGRGEEEGEKEEQAGHLQQVF